MAGVRRMTSRYMIGGGLEASDWLKSTVIKKDKFLF